MKQFLSQQINANAKRLRDSSVMNSSITESTANYISQQPIQQSTQSTQDSGVAAMTLDLHQSQDVDDLPVVFKMI